MTLDELLQQLQVGLLAQQQHGNSCRLFHGRGGCYQGLEWLVVDSFLPVLVVTYFAPPEPSWEAQWLPQLVNLARTQGIEGVVVQRRYLAGAPSDVIDGHIPAACYAVREGLRFHLQLAQRQNSGFFLDMEPGRQWVTTYSPGRRVLNLFAYTCAFSVVAVAAGSTKVVNVDMSSNALSQGRDNHHLNQLPLDSVVFLRENIMKSWGRIRRQGPYDVIIFDPPSYQPGSFIAERDYHKLVKRLPELCAPGADILACLNAPELPLTFLNTLFDTADSCELKGRLAANPDFPDKDSERQLKLMHYRYR